MSRSWTKFCWLFLPLEVIQVLSLPYSDYFFLQKNHYPYICFGFGVCREAGHHHGYKKIMMRNRCKKNLKYSHSHFSLPSSGQASFLMSKWRTLNTPLSLDLSPILLQICFRECILINVSNVFRYYLKILLLPAKLVLEGDDCINRCSWQSCNRVGLKGHGSVRQLVDIHRSDSWDWRLCRPCCSEHC